MQFTASIPLEAARTNRRIVAEAVRFRESNEGWFDGTPRSVDRRLAACDRVLTLAKAAVARSPFDWQPHEIIAELTQDRQALAGLREDLLTGGNRRVVDVVRPRQQRTAFFPPDPPAHINESLKPLWRQDVEQGIDPMQRHLPEQYRSKSAAPHAYDAPRQNVPAWDEKAGDWAVPSLESDMTGGGSRSFTPPQPKYSPPGPPGAPPSGPNKGAPPVPPKWPPGYLDQFEPLPTNPRKKEPGTIKPQLAPEQMRQINEISEGKGRPFNPIKFHPNTPPTTASLSSGEMRWVSLQAPRFLQANVDVAYYLSELAIRAHHHAIKQASAADHPKAVARAFVAAVIENARRLPPPPAPRTAAVDEFRDLPDSAMWL